MWQLAQFIGDRFAACRAAGLAALLLALSGPAAALLAMAGSAIAAPVPAAACAACPALAVRGGLDATPEAAALCTRALGVLAALGQWRSGFLAAPHYANLFPTVYWHTTRMELEWIAAGRHDQPQEVLRQIDIFYDAYLWNRLRFEAGLPPEPHWREHFTAAAEADQDFGQIGRGMAFDTPETVRLVLSSGVFAHIDFDMPRTLRLTFTQRADQALPEAPLAADFRRAGDIFSTVSAGLVEDIGAAIRATSDWDPTLLRPEVMRWFDDILAALHAEVLARRNRAWRAAFAAAPLPTLDAPHPPPTPRPPVDCPP